MSTSAPDTLKFAPSHEWILPGEPATVGISDHAQAELGDIVYLELPQIGRIVKAGESVAVVESVKAASDIYCPVSGEIVAVNEAAAGNTGVVNSDPYGEGWLFKIKVSASGELEPLLDAAAYAAQAG